jgi:signal peptidase II
VKPVRFFLIALIIIASDQVTKAVVAGTMHYRETRPVIDGILSLTLEYNTGGAFSLFQARNGVFILIASLAIVALVYAYIRYQRDDLVVGAALALALGGAVGNLTDRIRFGYVVDFFDIHVWPIFNVADSAISVGIVLLAWRFLTKRPEASDSKSEALETRTDGTDTRLDSRGSTIDST